MSQRQRDDMVILAHIRELHRLSLQSYGRPHMPEELQEQGLNVEHRRVGRPLSADLFNKSPVRQRMVETFFKSLKAELIWRNRWESRRQEAEGAMFQYIKGFYNPHRRHSSLGGKSLLAFERKDAEMS